MTANAIIERKKRLSELKERKRINREKRQAEERRLWVMKMKVRRRCPHCDSKNIIFNNNGIQTDWMQCEDCHCTGPTSDGYEQALERWNKRFSNEGYCA